MGVCGLWNAHGFPAELQAQRSRAILSVLGHNELAKFNIEDFFFFFFLQVGFTLGQYGVWTLRLRPELISSIGCLTD